VDDLLPGADAADGAAGADEGDARRGAAAEPPPERPRSAGARDAPATEDGAAPADEAPPPERDVFAAARAACEAEGGTFGRAPGGGEARICFRTPDDANAPCRTGADCAGACLARSRTCAPVVPLMGCHEVILSNGIRATECVQ